MGQNQKFMSSVIKSHLLQMNYNENDNLWLNENKRQSQGLNAGT